MANKYVGITPRASGIQMSFSFKGKRVREYFKIESNPSNMKLVNRRREAALFDIELGRFDYYKHFPNVRIPLKMITHNA